MMQNPMNLQQSLVVPKIRQRLNKVPLQVALGIPFVKTVLLEQLLMGKIIQKKAKEVQNVQLVLVDEITLTTLRFPPLLVGTRTQLKTAIQAVLVVVKRIKLLVSLLL